MKRIHFIKIIAVSFFIMGLLGFTSCRSTKGSCGLAEQKTTIPNNTADHSEYLQLS